METKICAFTGHRTIYSRHASSLPIQIDRLVEELISQGYTEFRTGGAIGFDTLVALKIIEKKEKYPQIKLHLYLPCRGQESLWNDNLKRAYYYVLKRADSVRYSSESYMQGCMHKRNREMVDQANLCVAYCSGGKGGSAYTVSYAEKNGIRVINLFK